MIHVRDTAGLKRYSIARLRTGGGLKQLAALRVRGTSGIANYLGGLVVTASADTLVGYGASATPIRIVTEAVTISVKGGNAGYSIAWTVDAGWSATSPGSFVTAFGSPPVAANGGTSATAIATITGPGGPKTITINLSVSNFGDGIAP